MEADGRERATYTLIRDLPASDRPRERLRDYGADSLATQELLAILLRTGSSKESALRQAERLLKDFGGLRGLARTPFKELCNAYGMGEAKTSQILAAIELGMRTAAQHDGAPQTIRGADDVALLCQSMGLLDQEHVRVLALDARNRIVSDKDQYIGSAHTTHVRLAEILKDPIRVGASGIVLVHNHPSGDPTPSAADIRMTGELEQACIMVGIDFHDHVVIGAGKHVSMRGVGLGFAQNGIS
jgi:DNA repair protein RadC